LQAKLKETAVPLMATLADLLWTTETALWAGNAKTKGRTHKDRTRVNRISQPRVNHRGMRRSASFHSRLILWFEYQYNTYRTIGVRPTVTFFLWRTSDS